MLCKVVLPSNEIFKLYPLPKSFQELQDNIKSRLAGASLDNMILKYVDADQELVVLNSQEDFQTAIVTCEADNIKTLKIYVQKHEDVQLLHIQNFHSSGLVLEKGSAKQSQEAEGSSSANRQGRSNLSLINSQLQVIDGIIGSKVKEAVHQNVKGLFSGLQNRLKSHGDQEYDISKSASIGANCGDCVCCECKEQITSVKYVCLECVSYKACEACEAKGQHAHPLLKVRNSMNQSMTMETNYRSKYSSMFSTPEKKGSSGTRFSFTKTSGSGEKKIKYSGKILLENSRNQQIKTYPCQEEKVTVIVKNTGTETWPRDVRLSCVNGIYRNREESLLPLGPNEKQMITLHLSAPAKTDRYLSQWRLYYTEEEKAKSFGESLFIELQVEEKKCPLKQSSLPVQCKKNLSCNLVKRAITLTEAFLNRNEKTGREMTGEDSKRLQVAEWLNEVFPGDIEEKLEFLNNCKYSEDVEDMSRIVELYLQSLSKRKVNAQKTFTPGNQEICAALV